MNNCKLPKVSLLTLIVLAMAGSAVAAPPVIKLATLAPRGTSFHQDLLAMGQQWGTAPGGGARLTIFTDGSQGGEADMVRKMRVGQIQAAMLTVSGLSDIDDSVAALQNMPMMFRNAQELEHVRDKLRPKFEARFREKGFIVLFWGDAGWVRFFSREPALTPDDFKKMKMFTWAGESKTIAIWDAAGYRAVPLEITDVLLGLDRGLIDVIPSEPYYALAGQFYRKAPNMLDLKWAPLVGGTVITEKAFNALPPETQKAMKAAAEETGIKLTRESRARSEEAIKVMQEKGGLKVQRVSPELEAQWRAKCEEFYPMIRGAIVPAETFDEVQRILKEYRESVPQAKP